MFETNWMEKWQGAVNSNGPMSWIGKHFTADFLFGFGDTQYQVSFREGKLVSFSDEIGPETCYGLAIRGPAETWTKFCQEVPPPMYNDLSAPWSTYLRGRSNATLAKYACFDVGTRQNA